jgi:pre-60S factor REI1
MDAQLTSTTAPGTIFATRADLAAHYKSEWHRYNLKRREAGLPVLLLVDFEARLEAAKALRQDKQAGKDHLKRGASVKTKSEKKKEAAAAAVQTQEQNGGTAPVDPTQDVPMTDGDAPTPQQVEEEEAIEIDPRQCLFDKHMSKSVKANVDRMHRKYGFFIPDVEYLDDLEGLVGYCHEKVKLGHMCLYCQRVFRTWQGCQKHMMSKEHCKIRYELHVDMEDFAVFYDFSEADAAFLGTRLQPDDGDSSAVMVEEEDAGVYGAGEEEGEWEDISDDEMEEDDDQEPEENLDDEGLYSGYQEEVSRMGFDVTALGELVFPDGRIIGHRALKRYYKQRAPQNSESTAVVAARSAAGERVFRGQVFNINDPMGHSENSIAMARAGLAPGLAAGRAGKGILTTNGPNGSFSQLSVYRYRAAVRKQRMGDREGKRANERLLGANTNRMDKKANRLMNNVSVAHAKR